MKVIKHKDKWYLQSDTGYKEILLSTDTELQKDGVQAIDDEFLEWFVKNPSCEEVEVLRYKNIGYRVYPLIIQKEESKQETLEEAASIFSKQFLDNGNNSEFEAQAAYLGFIQCAKWQQEQDKNKYSEEDLREAFIEGYKQRAEKSDLIFDNASRMYAIDLFEQYKNK